MKDIADSILLFHVSLVLPREVYCYLVLTFLHYICPICHSTDSKCVSEQMQTQENHLQLYYKQYMHQFILGTITLLVFWCYYLAFEQPKFYMSKFHSPFGTFGLLWQPSYIISFYQTTLLHSLFGIVVCSIFYNIVFFKYIFFFGICQPNSYIIAVSYFKLFYEILSLTKINLGYYLVKM